MRREQQPAGAGRPHLPASSDDLVIDVSDDHGMDHGDPKQSAEDPLQDVKPHV